MPNASEYLKELDKQRDNLADHIIEAGVEATQDETLNVLVPKAGTLYGKGKTDFINNITNGGTNFSKFFYQSTWLTECPELDTSKATTTNSMFYGCSSLTSAPELDLSNVEDAANMFYNCGALTEVPDLYLPKATTLSQMFYYCRALKSVGKITLGSATSLNQMFLGANKLTAFPEMDTSTVTNFYGAFRSDAGVYNTTTAVLPLYDTSKGESFSYMLYGLRAIPTCPDFDFSNATGARNLFQESHFVTIPNVVMPKCTTVSEMFVGCERLTTIERLDWSSATNVSSNTFYRCSKLANITFEGTINTPLRLSYCTKLTTASLLSLFEALVDRTAEEEVYTLTLGSTLLSKLSTEQKAIATNKGWVLA